MTIATVVRAARSGTRGWLAAWAAAVAIPLSAQAADSKEPPRGVVVEQVLARSGAERSGVRVGDVLLSWSRPADTERPAASGAFTTLFDLRRAEIEEASRAPLHLHGLRD